MSNVGREPGLQKILSVPAIFQRREVDVRWDAIRMLLIVKFPRLRKDKFPVGDHWKMRACCDDFAYFMKAASESHTKVFTISDLIETWMDRNSIGAELCSEVLKRDNAKSAIEAALTPMVRFRMIDKVTAGFRPTSFGYFCYEVLCGTKTTDQFSDSLVEVAPAAKSDRATFAAEFDKIRVSKPEKAQPPGAAPNAQLLKPYHSRWAPRTLHSAE